MIARSTVTFAELQQLLVDLGFAVGKRGKFWFFEHPPSETSFGFRPYRAREKVTLADLHMTRKHLDWRGLLTPETFDDWLIEGQPSMFAKSTISFAELRQFLLDLGFTVSKHGKFWFFEHMPSETNLSYRPYRVRERVTLRDLHTTRSYLDRRDVLSEKRFDDRLKKATA